MNRPASRLPAIVGQHQQEILTDWINRLLAASSDWRAGRVQEAQVRDESARFLDLVRRALSQGVEFDSRSAQWSDTRDFLSDLSRGRAAQGFTPSQVATFIFSLKQPLFARACESLKSDPTALVATLWEITTLLDGLGDRKSVV